MSSSPSLEVRELSSISYHNPLPQHCLRTTSRPLCSTSPPPVATSNSDSTGSSVLSTDITDTGTLHTTSSVTAVSKAVEERLHAIIHGVNGAKYRLFIRAQIKILSEDPEVLALAKSKFMEEKLWVLHAFNFRRKLSKAPEIVFEGPEFLQFLTLVESIIDDRVRDDRVENITHHSHDHSQDHSHEHKQFRALLLSALIQRADTELREEIASARTLLRCSDLRLPHEWYAPARLMKRKIIFHGGPTNSGMWLYLSCLSCVCLCCAALAAVSA